MIEDLKNLLSEIDRDIPLLQLAISASGESLSTSLPSGISPSRLLQASTLLIVGDTQYAQDPRRSIQIGPPFTLSVYMLFLGHATVLSTPKDGNPRSSAGNTASADTKAQGPVYGLREHDRKPLWQEAIHKARVRLCRSGCDPTIEENGCDGQNYNVSGSIGSLQYAYHLEIIEDLDDNRAHEELGSPSPHNGIPKAGIRELIPIHQFAKIFYTDTGSLLNIGDGTDGENNPVLLLKRDINATRPQMPECAMHGEVDDTSDDDSKQETDEYNQADVDQQLLGESLSKLSTSRSSKKAKDICATALPKHLDPEWIAFEVFEEDDEQSDTSSNSDIDVGLPDEVDGSGHSPRKTPPRLRTAMDSILVSQIKNLSIHPTSRDGLILSKSDSKVGQPSRDLTVDLASEAQDFASRSPFGAITTSLSLIEMLIRLAGLQEFQQASHLSIPDHILTFFLEETSTTGLTGEAMWRARSETKQRVGFDPYTDTT